MNANKSQTHYVTIGRLTTLVSLIVALLVARPLLGQFDQAFQYIQEFTGFFSPGITAIFLLGMFWRKTTSAGALAAAIGSAAASFAFWMWLPSFPFMDRMAVVFLICIAAAVIVSLMGSQKSNQSDTSVHLDQVNFSTTKSFNFAAIGVVIVLIALYSTWW